VEKMSERIEKDLEKVRREIENLEGEITNFKESLEGLLDLQNYYQVLASLIQNKFISLNENLRLLIDENKGSLESRLSEGTSGDIGLIDEWTTSQKENLETKFSETSGYLTKVQETVLSVLSESRENFENITNSFGENIDTVLGSHTQDLERLANSQVNVFRKAISDVKENVSEIKGNSLSTFQKNTDDMKKQLKIILKLLKISCSNR